MSSFKKSMGTFFYRSLMIILQLITRLLFRLEISGLNEFYSWCEKNKKPLIIIARHKSQWDPIIIGSAISYQKDIRPVYLTKHEMKRYFRFIPCSENHVIYLNRKQTRTSTFKKIFRAIIRGKEIVIFPEGTTIPEKKSPHRGVIDILEKFKKQDIPIFPLNIKAIGPYGKPRGKWYYYLLRKAKINLRIGQPIFLKDLERRVKGLNDKESKIAMVELLLKESDKI